MKYLFLYCLLLFLFHLIRKIYTSCFLYVLVLNIFLQTRGNPTQTIINAFGTCLKFHAELSTYLTFFLPILDPPPPDRGMTLERDPPLHPKKNNSKRKSFWTPLERKFGNKTQKWALNHLISFFFCLQSQWINDFFSNIYYLLNKKRSWHFGQTLPYPNQSASPKTIRSAPPPKNFRSEKSFRIPLKENLETNTEMGIESPYFFLPFCLQSKRITCNDFFSNIDNLLDKKILTLWPDPPPHTHPNQSASIKQFRSEKAFEPP